jgi:hypothetical protein
MGKGGGGGDGGAAAAAAAEAARKARIAGNITAVKERFFGREAERDIPEALYGSRMKSVQDEYGNYNQVPEQYVTNQSAIDEATNWNESRPFTDNPTQARLTAFGGIEDRVRDRFLPDFEQDIGDARRELKFALSRRNLLGSSAQADAEMRLQDRIGEGRRGIDQRVAGARSEKEALDQQLMNNLIGQAQADVSRSSLLGGVGSSFLANTNRAINAANQQSMGNMFQDVGSLFKEINDQKAIQQGMANAAMFSSAMRGNPTNLFTGNSTSGSDGDVQDWT